MNSQEVSEQAREILANVVGVYAQIIEPSTARFEGVGAQQYETCQQLENMMGEPVQLCRQRFEDFTVHRFIDELLDEIVDQANYAIMMMIAHPNSVNVFITARDVIRNAATMYDNIVNVRKYALANER